MIGRAASPPSWTAAGLYVALIAHAVMSHAGLGVYLVQCFCRAFAITIVIDRRYGGAAKGPLLAKPQPKKTAGGAIAESQSRRDAESGGEAWDGKGGGAARAKTCNKFSGELGSDMAVEGKCNADSDDDLTDLDVPLSSRRAAICAGSVAAAASSAAPLRCDQVASNDGAAVHGRGESRECVSEGDVKEEDVQHSEETSKWRYDGHEWIGKRVRRTIWGLRGEVHEMTGKNGR